MTRPTTLLAKAVGTAAVGTLLLTVATPSAWAFWNGGGSGSGTSKANALGTPTVVATALVGIPTFRVTTAPAGLLPTSYRVTQAGDPVCTIVGATGACTQLRLYAGAPVSFTITAARGPWTSLTATTCTYPKRGPLGIILGSADCAPAIAGLAQRAAVTPTPPDTTEAPTPGSSLTPTTVPAPEPTVTPTTEPTATATPTTEPTPAGTTSPATPDPDPTPTGTAEPATEATPTPSATP